MKGNDRPFCRHWQAGVNVNLHAFMILYFTTDALKKTTVYALFQKMKSLLPTAPRSVRLPFLPLVFDTWARYFFAISGIRLYVAPSCIGYPSWYWWISTTIAITSLPHRWKSSFHLPFHFVLRIPPTLEVHVKERAGGVSRPLCSNRRRVTVVGASWLTGERQYDLRTAARAAKLQLRLQDNRQTQSWLLHHSLGTHLAYWYLVHRYEPSHYLAQVRSMNYKIIIHVLSLTSARSKPKSKII